MIAGGDPGGTRCRPTEVRLKRVERVLEVSFEDGSRFGLPAELLRVESPSAEVQGHGGPEGRQVVSGRRDVAITTLEPVGHYAVRLVFDDGHDSGLYTWTYLRQLGQRQEQVWAEYLAELAARGLSRDP